MAAPSHAGAQTVSIPCRSCGGDDLQPILSLGLMPAANQLRRADQLDAPEPRYPLDLVFCPACSLVQITESIPPEELFREYVYFSSYSETMLASCEALSGRLTRERGLDGRHLVVDIASNDGYLLQFYQHLGVPVLGIEPARNVARVATERGIPTIEEFFGTDLAATLIAQGRRADVIHANNVLAHVPDLNGVVRAMATLLRDDGVAVIETPYVRDLVERAEFDTIYHEHLCYYSLTTLDALFRRHGLVIQDVEHLAIHGGSLRLFAGHAGRAGQPSPAPSRAVRALLDDEHERGLDRVDYYQHLAARAATIKQGLRDLLVDLTGRGHRIAAYGAAAKGATLLNYCGLGPDVIEYVVDRSSHKQGLYMPGVRLPIGPPALLAERPPDYLLILAWNLADEIMRQQAAFRAAGGRFILPIPEVRIIEEEPS
jgi:SAM-dependent methyltransferase